VRLEVLIEAAENMLKIRENERGTGGGEFGMKKEAARTPSTIGSKKGEKEIGEARRGIKRGKVITETAKRGGFNIEANDNTSGFDLGGKEERDVSNETSRSSACGGYGKKKRLLWDSRIKCVITEKRKGGKKWIAQTKEREIWEEIAGPSIGHNKFQSRPNRGGTEKRKRI